MNSEYKKNLKKKIYVLIITIFAYLGGILMFILIFYPIKLQFPNYDIFNFEFAWTSETVSIIFEYWDSEGISLHIKGVYWDFLFLLIYSTALAGTSVLCLRKSAESKQILYQISFLSPYIAALFDIIENCFLLNELNRPQEFSKSIPLIVGLMALIKFLLLGVWLGLFIRLKIWILKHKSQEKK